jgi:hypothetical protein
MNKSILLIPHYNNPLGLELSINSIGNEEMIDVLIIDDGSTKMKINETKCIDNFNAKGKIYFHYLESNRGIEHALNTGLKIIEKQEYKYIARLDCGDLCMSNRFHLQESFLDDNLDIALVGAGVEVINDVGHLLYVINPPTEPNIIRKKIFYNSSVIIHPSIMFRTSMLKVVGYYPTTFKHNEDYAFYFNIIKNHKVANLKSNLIRKIHDENSISVKYRKSQAKTRIKVLIHNFNYSIFAFYGLVRFYVLYVLPMSLLLNIKKVIYK